MALRRTLFWMISLLLVVSFVDVSPAAAKSRRRRSRRPVSIAPAESGSPWLRSRCAIVLDTRTGESLFERDSDRPMYPASTTKVLTAIIAIDSGRLDEVVTIQPGDVHVQPSSIGLVPGEKLLLRDLVYGLLLRSGNDAALAIARHLGGSIPNFATMMNAKARAIGCTGSNFTNPHGLPDRRHFTTARDLGRIMVYAMKNPEFRHVTGTQYYQSTSSTRRRFFVNKNRLLRLYPGTTGGKPGYTRAAQQTLVASAMRSDRELVVVCLHSAGRALWSDAAHLLDFGFRRVGGSTRSSDRGASPRSEALAPAP